MVGGPRREGDHFAGWKLAGAVQAGTFVVDPLNRRNMTVFPIGEIEHENLPTRVVDRLPGVGVFVG